MMANQGLALIGHVAYFGLATEVCRAFNKSLGDNLF